MGKTPTAVRISENSRYAYICNIGDSSLSIVDLSTVEVSVPSVKTIAVGAFPSSVAVTTDNRYVCVCNTGTSTLSVIDLTSPSLAVFTVKVGTSPSAVAITKNNMYACVCNDIDGTVSFIDLCKIGGPRPIVYTVPVGENPLAVAMSVDGTYACVCNNGSGTLSLIDLSTITCRRPTVYTLNVGAGPVALSLTHPSTPPTSPVVAASIPQRPPLVKGTIKKRSHKAALLARWKPSPSPNVVKYEIFSFNNYIASIPAKDALYFQTPLFNSSDLKYQKIKKRLRRLARAFRIRAVDADGRVSPFTILKVKRL